MITWNVTFWMIYVELPSVSSIESYTYNRLWYVWKYGYWNGFVLLKVIYIQTLAPNKTFLYSPTKVKHHLTCFNNIFSNNEFISNRFAVFVTCTHILTYLWNRLLINFYLCVYDRVCKVPRVLFNICVCERKLIFLCVEFQVSFSIGLVWCGEN